MTDSIPIHPKAAPAAPFKPRWTPEHRRWAAWCIAMLAAGILGLVTMWLFTHRAGVMHEELRAMRAVYESKGEFMAPLESAERFNKAQLQYFYGKVAGAVSQAFVMLFMLIGFLQFRSDRIMNALFAGMILLIVVMQGSHVVHGWRMHEAESRHQIVEARVRMGELATTEAEASRAAVSGLQSGNPMMYFALATMLFLGPMLVRFGILLKQGKVPAFAPR